jgi:hypothetical protein
LGTGEEITEKALASASTTIMTYMLVSGTTGCDMGKVSNSIERMNAIRASGIKIDVMVRVCSILSQVRISLSIRVNFKEIVSMVQEFSNFPHLTL